MVTTLVLDVPVVLQLLASRLALLIKVMGNRLAWMLRALSLSPVISTRISNFPIVQLRTRANITSYYLGVHPSRLAALRVLSIPRSMRSPRALPDVRLNTST